ncbi:SusC/RagA family TonB-linked outer membrane protein [soil metagenome]
MRTRSLLLMSSIVLLASPIDAQVRTITGTVSDSISGSGIGDARVSVRATALVVSTAPDGRFSISGVPAGEVTLAVRRIGYRPADVRVPADQQDVRVGLSRDRLQLAEVVITGQATSVARQNLANAVATVSGEDLAIVSAQSLEHALQGKVPGAMIQANSGAPGGGVQVRMRGVTSINAASEPLYVVDGVVVSNVAIPSNQNAVTRAAGGSNPSLTQDAQVNRIADINPNDIENIEVLKGASAAAIYGSRASNGVVIITTRRGRAGAPQLNVTQRVGFHKISNTLGSRTFNSAAEAEAADYANAASFFQPGVVYDQERELAGRTPLSAETSANFSGGNDNTRYFVSGLWQDEGGIIANTGFEKQSLRANIEQDIGDRLDISLNTNVIRTLAQRGLTNNDNNNVSFWMVFPFTPSFVDLRQRADGTFPNNPYIFSNPLETAALMTNDETVWRSIVSGRATFAAITRPNYTLQLVGRAGADRFNQENVLLFPPDLQFEPLDDGEPGTSLLSNSNNLDLGGGASAVLTLRPESGRFSSTFSTGLTAASRDLRIARTVSRNLVGGIGITSAGTNIQILERKQRVEDFGLFAQEELLLLGERLLLTAGVSADRSSVNGDPDKYYVYPKFAGSYRFEHPFRSVDALKVRLAYGQSGNQPLFGQKFTPLTATQNITGLPALVVESTVGSPSLRPENQRELEGGVDLILASERASVEITGFRKDVTELLLQRTLAPSSGFATEIFNGGRLRTTGMEIGTALMPIQGPDLEWLVRVSYASTRSTIVELPVPTFATGGFGTALGSFRIEQGASPTQIVGNDSLPDGSRIVRKVGDANPDFMMSFSNSITLRRFRVYGLLDWQSGGSIINLTKFLYDLGQNTADYADPITVGGVATTKGAHRLAVFGKQTAVYVEDASFVKLREVTLSYELPAGFVSRLGGRARTAHISLSGRNLLTFTDYTGLDPEVSNFGNQQIARNIDVAPFPPSRSFWFSASLGF